MAQKQNTLNLIMITTMVIFILCFLTIARKIVTTLTFAKQELLIPIVKVSEQMKVLAQGHFDSRLDLPEDDSEVGIMVQAVHFMNDNFTDVYKRQGGLCTGSLQCSTGCMEAYR